MVMLGNRWCIARSAPRARLTLRIWQTKTTNATASKVRVATKVVVQVSVRTQVLKTQEMLNARIELRENRAPQWIRIWKNKNAAERVNKTPPFFGRSFVHSGSMYKGYSICN